MGKKKAKAAGKIESRVRMIPFKQIDLSRLKNHRTDLGDMDELVESIRENGLLEPVLVSQEHFNGRGHLLPGGEKVYDLFYLSAGERRYRAIERIREEAVETNRRLGRKGAALPLDEVPAVVREGNEVDAKIDQMIENLHRKDPNPLETAEGIRQLSQLNVPMEDIARRIKRDPGWCEKLLALRNKTSHEVQAALTKGEINLTAAFVIMKKPLEEQGELLKTYKTTKEASGSRNVAKRSLDKAVGKKLVMSGSKVTKVFLPIQDADLFSDDYWRGARDLRNAVLGIDDSILKEMKKIVEERKAPAPTEG